METGFFSIFSVLVRVIFYSIDFLLLETEFPSPLSSLVHAIFIIIESSLFCRQNSFQITALLFVRFSSQLRDTFFKDMIHFIFQLSWSKHFSFQIDSSILGKGIHIKLQLIYSRHFLLNWELYFILLEKELLLNFTSLYRAILYPIESSIFEVRIPFRFQDLLETFSSQLSVRFLKKGFPSNFTSYIRAIFSSVNSSPFEDPFSFKFQQSCS